MSTSEFPASAWFKSSYSGNSTDCVEVAFAPATWNKSSYSGNTTNCVEVAVTQAVVGVRDTKHRDGGALAFTAPAWFHFSAQLRGARA